MIALNKPLRGLLFIMVGPGGVGKNALMQTVLPRFAHLQQLPTATTRAPREGELNGRERLFVTLDEFNRMIAHGELIEHEEVHPGKFYGVPRKQVEDALYDGIDLIADIEIAGAEKVRAAYPHNTVLIFIAPPSMSALRERMEHRHETQSGIHERLVRAEREMRFQSRCKYVIINDVLETASRQLEQVICEERSQRDQRFAQVLVEPPTPFLETEVV